MWHSFSRQCIRRRHRIQATTLQSWEPYCVDRPCVVWQYIFSLLILVGPYWTGYFLTVSYSDRQNSVICDLTLGIERGSKLHKVKCLYLAVHCYKSCTILNPTRCTSTLRAAATWQTPTQPFSLWSPEKPVAKYLEFLFQFTNCSWLLLAYLLFCTTPNNKLHGITSGFRGENFFLKPRANGMRERVRVPSCVKYGYA